MTIRAIDNESQTTRDLHDLIHDNLRLQIEYLPTKDIKLPERRLKKHSDRQMVGIKASLRTFGFVAPLLINHDYLVIDGEAVLEAAKQLGLAKVPVVRLDHLGEHELRLLRLTLNKLATMSDWNQPELKLELIELLDVASEVSIEVTGFALAEIDEIVSESDSGELGSDGLPEPLCDGPAISRLGDLWYLGDHRLLCGSSLERASFELLLHGEQARMVLTDSPYNVKIGGNVSGLGKKTHREFVQGSGELSKSEFATFQINSIGLHADFCCDGALIYLFMDWKHGGEMYNAVAANNLTMVNVAVWVKSAGAMGSLYRSQYELVFIAKRGTAPHRNCVQLGKFGRYRTNAWMYPGMNSFGRNRNELLQMHPTCKNLTMFEDAIRDVTHRGEIVLDGFAGSGTTIIAAEKTGRLARAIELDPLYVDCVMLAAWILGRDPASKVFVVSYGLQLSEALTGKVRSIVTHPSYKRIFPRTRIRVGANRVGHFMTTAGGECMAASQDSAITGFGTH